MSNTELWESGHLGRDEQYAQVAVGSKEAVDDALGLQLISIRLQKGLLNDLKRIADHHGIGYQPMIRDLLNRFASAEIKKILVERLEQIKVEEQQDAETAPVRDFLERRQA